MSLKRKHPDDNDAKAEIYQSAPIEDRSSKFVAYFSPTVKPKELQGLSDIQSASHKILGWRRESNQQSITKATQYVTGSDDDGEKYGGKRIEKVLNLLRIEGACVVARWYGGVMLGPVRFDHIENCVRDAIDQWQRVELEELTKRRKVEKEKEEHALLAKGLAERDQSINVLRTLAIEKEQAAKGETPEAAVEADTVHARDSLAQKIAVDYHQMPLDRLRVLDKARDATLSFLLKRIDKAEAEVEARKGNKKPP